MKTRCVSGYTTRIWCVKAQYMTFAQRRNRLKLHLSERILVVKRHTSVYLKLVEQKNMAKNLTKVMHFLRNTAEITHLAFSVRAFNSHFVLTARRFSATSL
jgi:hypothetical protein